MAKPDPANPRQTISPPPNVKGAVTDTAFDTWLHRGLHQLYDNVANEPVPDELLRIIEADRTNVDASRIEAAPETVAGSKRLADDP